MIKAQGPVIIGGGIAGMRTALQLLRQGWNVKLLDRHPINRMGGLGRTAFGGMALNSTREQKLWRIPDTPERMLEDWLSFADFNADDIWPRRWAEHYVEHCRRDVYDDVRSLGLSFMPAVNWVERGLYRPGNSLPRYHVLWGTGWGLVEALKRALQPYLASQRLQWLAEAEVLDFQEVVSGWDLRYRIQGQEEELTTPLLILAAGGWTGQLQKVREYWPRAPSDMLNGSHPFCNGALHVRAEQRGAAFTHQEAMWNYAAGIAHPQPEFEGHGLSLIPPKSALWLDHKGRRLGPEPWVAGFDTHALCHRMSDLEQPWTWQLLNRRIALRELSISGAEHNPDIREINRLRFARQMVMGNTWLYEQLQQSPDVVVAETLPELAEAMNRRFPTAPIDLACLSSSVQGYDQQVSMGRAYWNDDQLRRLDQLRQWRSERLRTCSAAPILQSGSGPLVAMRLRLITRKSLGGIVTNINSQVIGRDGQAMAGLYAVGEMSGFGGGGSSGQRSLEGTFIAGCHLTAWQAARHIGSGA
ncbi:MAG: FAD-dependent oxidoreductase [Pseudomonadales bacterium]|nr:FAD-dependent oxidoreductase [Pseudomonadales bacterium]